MATKKNLKAAVRAKLAAKKSAKSPAKVVAKTARKTPGTEKISTAAFIKAEIKRGKLADEKILEAARKRAPTQKIANHYVSWYRWQMTKDSKGARA